VGSILKVLKRIPEAQYQNYEIIIIKHYVPLISTAPDLLMACLTMVSLCLTMYPILPAALGPGVYSACNRNEYQKQKKKVSGE
jgi:hypothetical protein